MRRSQHRRNRRLRIARHASIGGARGCIKRTLDIAVSTIVILLGWPLGVVIAIIVRLSSHGPALYRQRRLGLGGREFTMLKFRTMCVDAEADGRAVWAVDRDSRCTPVGGVMRRFGIDELPQVWNVLRGDMSLVGPRPERPEFARRFARRWPRYDERHGVRGGITGLAQVRGLRGDTDVGERLNADLEYIARWSLAGDLLILCRTLPALLLVERQSTSCPDGSGVPATDERGI